jgi:hypothetical protein
MDLVYFIGLMVEVMQVNGEMVNNMVKDPIICSQVFKKLENGLKENV